MVMDHMTPSGPSKSTISGRSPRRFVYPGICILLTLVTSVVYLQVASFNFINLDDLTYVVKNAVVNRGITVDGILWAFSSFHASNWHPLTWISHMLDVQFFGMNPGIHHLTNVILHILNALLLFLVLDRMTGAMWRSAAVAALFALHPLHVESVVWISERKDVLSTFFWMLTMASYFRYVQKRTVGRYLVVVLGLVLGLLSKPMLVTLPFALLLLDFWPLHRWDPFQTRGVCTDNVRECVNPGFRKKGMLILIAEKIPLIVCAMLSSIVTFHAQQSGGAVQSFDSLSIGPRLENAVTSYAAYLGKMVWPHDLAVYYPYTDSFTTFALSVLLLLLITVAVLLAAKSLPYLVTGWFWYMGTLIPVIGIVQVGSQSMADRYTYVPLIGIFIMMVWGLADLFARQRYGRTVFWATFLVFPLLMWVSWVQVGLWKDSEILYRHALDVTRGNYAIHYNLGTTLLDRGDIDGALREYQETLSIKPDFIEAHNNLGTILLLKGYQNEAIKHLSESLRLYPHQSEVYNNLGAAYLHKGDILKAIGCFEEAVRENKHNANAIKNLNKARSLLNQG
jgi:protein O-mannosyl-transferase